MTETADNYTSLLDFIERSELKDIMKRFSITSRQQVRNILTGKSKNVGFLKAIVLKADENKQILEKAKRR